MSESEQLLTKLVLLLNGCDCQCTCDYDDLLEDAETLLGLPFAATEATP